MDLTSLTTAVDFTTLGTAILAVAGSVIGVIILIVAVRKVLAMIKGW